MSLWRKAKEAVQRWRKGEALEPLQIEVIPMGNAVGLQIGRGDDVYVAAILPLASAQRLSDVLGDAARLAPAPTERGH